MENQTKQEQGITLLGLTQQQGCFSITLSQAIEPGASVVLRTETGEELSAPLSAAGTKCSFALETERMLSFYGGAAVKFDVLLKCGDTEMPITGDGDLNFTFTTQEEKLSCGWREQGMYLVPYVSRKYRTFHIALADEYGRFRIWTRERLIRNGKLPLKYVRLTEERLELEPEDGIGRTGKLVIICGKRQQIITTPVDGALVLPLSLLRNLYQEGKLRYTICLRTEEDGGTRMYDFVQEPNPAAAENPSLRYTPPVTLEERDGVSLGILCYYTGEYNRLRLAIMPESEIYEEQYYVYLRRLAIENGVLRVESSCQPEDYAVEALCIRLRSSVEELSYPLSIRTEGDRIFGELDLKQVQLEQFYWDFVLTVGKNGKHYLLFLRMTENSVLDTKSYVYTDTNMIVAPYETLNHRPALQYHEVSIADTPQFRRKERMAMLLYRLFKPYWDSRRIWLVYEKFCTMAQDNGYYFFRFTQEKLPEKRKKNTYYIIDKSIPDYQAVKPYEPQVVDFLSLKHMIYLQAAQVLISTDAKVHAYAWRAPDTEFRLSYLKKPLIFLQHGVMAFKQCHRTYRKDGSNPCEQFITSSPTEQRIIADYFGYDKKEIPITGLCRWDVLHDKSDPNQREILLMPTWRNWLDETSDETFMESDYYKNYDRLLRSPELNALLEQYNVRLNFYIHPKFREFIGHFATNSSQITMYAFGEVPLNELIMRCSMMITDYSSASWDVFYQEKPVLFYLFDLEQYDTAQGSYIDMEADAFGDTTRTLNGLLGLVEEYVHRGFREKKQYAAMRDRLLPYRDDQNSQRVYDLTVKWLKKHEIPTLMQRIRRTLGRLKKRLLG